AIGAAGAVRGGGELGALATGVFTGGFGAAAGIGRGAIGVVGAAAPGTGKTFAHFGHLINAPGLTGAAVFSTVAHDGQVYWFCNMEAPLSCNGCSRNAEGVRGAAHAENARITFVTS